MWTGWQHRRYLRRCGVLLEIGNGPSNIVKVFRRLCRQPFSSSFRRHKLRGWHSHSSVLLFVCLTCVGWLPPIFIMWSVTVGVVDVKDVRAWVPQFRWGGTSYSGTSGRSGYRRPSTDSGMGRLRSWHFRGAIFLINKLRDLTTWILS